MTDDAMKSLGSKTEVMNSKDYEAASGGDPDDDHGPKKGGLIPKGPPKKDDEEEGEMEEGFETTTTPRTHQERRNSVMSRLQNKLQAMTSKQKLQMGGAGKSQAL